jgi:hypothetical protein
METMMGVGEPSRADTVTLAEANAARSTPIVLVVLQLVACPQLKEQNE